MPQFKPFSLADAVQAGQAVRMNNLKIQQAEAGMARGASLRNLAQMSRRPTYGEYEQPESQIFPGEEPIAGLKQTESEYDPQAHVENLQAAGEVDMAAKLQDHIGKMSVTDRKESAYKAEELAQLVFSAKGKPDVWDANSRIAVDRGLIEQDQVVPYSDDVWQRTMNDAQKISDMLGTDGSKAGVKLKKMEDGYFHKFVDGEDQGIASSESGESTKFWAAEKEENIGGRAKTRENQRDEKLKHQKSKAQTTQTVARRKEYDADISSLEDMDQLIDSALIGLEQGGGLGDKVVKIALSKLTNSKVRALAELQEYKTYGTAAQRMAGHISQFLYGEKTDEQKRQALDLLLSFRDKYVRPGLAAAKHYYRTLAKKDNLDLHSVARFSDQNDVKQALQSGLLTEDEAVEIIKTIGFKQ